MSLPYSSAQRTHVRTGVRRLRRCSSAWAVAALLLLASCGGGGADSTAPTTAAATSTTVAPTTVATVAPTSPPTTFSPNCGPAIHTAGIAVGHADDAQAVGNDLLTLNQLAKAEPNPRISAQISEVERRLGAVAIDATNHDNVSLQGAIPPLEAAVASLSSICQAATG